MHGWLPDHCESKQLNFYEFTIHNKMEETLELDAKDALLENHATNSESNGLRCSGEKQLRVSIDDDEDNESLCDGSPRDVGSVRVETERSDLLHYRISDNPPFHLTLLFAFQVCRFLSKTNAIIPSIMKKLRQNKEMHG